MALKAGTVEVKAAKKPADLAGSMAEAMEKALAAAWKDREGAALPKTGKEDRQLLFVAIAQGVVKHLEEQAADTFKISVDVTQVTGGAGEPRVKSENPSTITGTGGHFGAGKVKVTQVANNKVVSRGSGKITAVVTKGRLY